MPRKQAPPDQWPGFEIAIEGEGLTPSELPVRTLIELLEAAAKIVEEVAADSGLKLTAPRLVEVRDGSAAYDLRIPDKSAFTVVNEIQRQIKSRAVDAPAPIRVAVKRLHDAGGHVGSVRFTPYTRQHTKAKPLYVASPPEEVSTPFDATEELQGRVVGVMAGAKISVKLRLDDGRVKDFRAEDEEVARRAARLFLKTVRVQFEHEISDDNEAVGRLTSIHECEPTDDDFLSEIESVRIELEKTSSPVSGHDWLAELERDR